MAAGCWEHGSKLDTRVATTRHDCNYNAHPPPERYMKSLRILSIVACSLVASASYGTPDAASYLCAIDQTTGFKPDAGSSRWQSTTFRSDEKIIVSRTTKQPEKFEVKQLGSSLPSATCREMASGLLDCDGLGTNYLINLKTMRYMSVFANGYWNDDPENMMLKPGANTPSMGIGRCSIVELK